MIKHRSGKLNKVVDDLIRLNFIVQELRASVVGFEEMVDMYNNDVEFKDIYVVVQNPIVHKKS